MKRSQRWSAASLLGLWLLCAGCSKDNGNRNDYIPAEGGARQALEAALTAWQNGQPLGEVPVSGATVQTNDLRWKSGKKLTKFEIVKADPPDEHGHVWFTVKLSLAGSPAGADNRFVVLGKNPDLMVFSEEAYKQAAGG